MHAGVGSASSMTGFLITVRRLSGHAKVVVVANVDGSTGTAAGGPQWRIAEAPPSDALRHVRPDRRRAELSIFGSSRPIENGAMTRFVDGTD